MRIFEPHRGAAVSTAAPAEDLGPLPQWRLDDLYESPESQRFQSDMLRTGDEAKTFADKYRGKLEGLAGGRMRASGCSRRCWLTRRCKT